MSVETTGIYHVAAHGGDPQRSLDFYPRLEPRRERLERLLRRLQAPGVGRG